jgi:2-oxoglutarate/2-oxoacid ferredoxin oxidoreductase subunit alpha
MRENHRLSIKITGESGQGINSVGGVVAKALKKAGYNIFGYREYPSLIKGGYACYQIDFSDLSLTSSSRSCDVMVSLSRLSLHEYLPTLHPRGQVIHAVPHFLPTADEVAMLGAQGSALEYVPAAQLAQEIGGKAVMANTILTGVLWQILGLPLEPLKEVIRLEFAKKPEVIEGNIACLQAGYHHQLEQVKPINLTFQVSDEVKNDLLLTGNHALALGAIAAGVRAFYAYPMTPSSSILTYLADVYHQTGMLVKQVEDEISVAQMALGSMFVGTRALVATSGGGYDLMTETVSLAGMTETPFVCILAQRPGPATGLPTWTSASDLNLAVYSAHGEFPRCVLAASDPATGFRLIQEAFNLAEKYQIPVIVLTEKQIAESHFQLSQLPEAIPIQRGLVEDAQLSQLEPSDRFQITESGISPRWLPGQADATYVANSDEHLEDGSLTERALPSKAMYDKRLRKQEALLVELPEPELFGPESSVTLFVGWGSVKNPILDVLPAWNERYPDQQIAYLHYEYIFPVKTARFNSLVSSMATSLATSLATPQQRVVLVEQNATGQLGGLLTQHTGYQFTEKLLKYDGRPFFTEDIWNYLEKFREEMVQLGNNMYV